MILFSYFTYAPRYSAPTSTKYHSFGFIYLQNALDRAIINAHTGINVSYGIETQQMPYPCWINDRYLIQFLINKMNKFHFVLDLLIPFDKCYHYLWY